MNTRMVEILPRKNYAADYTELIDINLVDPISKLILTYEPDCAGLTGVAVGHPVRGIEKIELVDGSDVLHSMTGYENQALCIYDRKVGTMIHGQCLHNNSLEASYGLDFGRFLWDKELAFDPKQFRNPQLKVTYNSVAASAAGTSPVLEVFGYIFDEKAISPMGFLMSKEYYDQVMPAEDSYRYVDLPTDYPIRQLLVRGYRAGAYAPWNSVKEVRLSEDNLAKIPFDVKVEEYHRFMKGVWKECSELVYGYCTDSGTVFFITPTDYFANIIPVCVDNVTMYNPRATGGYATITGSSVAYFLGWAHGWLPNHCIQFPFGDQNDMDDWYDVTKKGSVSLRLRAGDNGANGYGQVVLQQLRRY